MQRSRFVGFFGLVVTLAGLAGCGATTGGDLTAGSASALKQAGVPRAAIRCNGRQVWNSSLRADADATVDEIMAELSAFEVEVGPDKQKPLRKRLRSRVMWRLVRNLLIAGHHNNLGVVALPGVKTADGRPVLLFRSGFTPDPDAADSCFQSLVRAGRVRHVANLYGGPMHTTDLEQAERAALQKAGGTYFLARGASGAAADWREHLREGADAKAAQLAAHKAVAAIINDNLLRPAGKAPTGNLHVHCGGGMHRTGMVVGIIDRCLNNADPAKIAADYKRHVGWRSDARPGGFEASNLDFISTFDCALLRKP